MTHETARTKVVFFAEAVTLAHIARPATLARALDPTRFDVSFAWSPRYRALFSDLPLRERTISSIEPAQFLAALESGGACYDLETLSRYVEEDLAVIEELQPDVVVGDFRLSLPVSARLKKIPYINITNAYWSPYSTAPIPTPDVPQLRWLPVRVAQAIFNLVRPIAFAANARPMTQLHRKFGVPSPPTDIRHVYTDADFVAYVDLPELVPMRALPSNHAFIGPILWSPSGTMPGWWSSLEAENRPIVYLTLGSSGMEAIMPRILAVLAELPVLGIVATAGRSNLVDVPANVRVADFLPGQAAAARSAFVICNGGSPTCYQALSVARPVLGICTNFDQQLNMTAVTRAGAGIVLAASSATVPAIKTAVETLLSVESYRAAAVRISDRIAAYDTLRRFTEILASTC